MKAARYYIGWRAPDPRARRTAQTVMMDVAAVLLECPRAYRACGGWWTLMAVHR